MTLIDGIKDRSRATELSSRPRGDDLSSLDSVAEALNVLILKLSKL